MARFYTNRPLGDAVPQGSVLNPVLFNLLLAPLPACITAGLWYPQGIAIYADDVAIWTLRFTR